MKSTRLIEVTVSPQGDILIDAVGFKGADCEKATHFLEEALGVAGPKQQDQETKHKENGSGRSQPAGQASQAF